MRPVRIAAASTLLAAGALLPATAIASAQGSDQYNCSDFSTQQQAQKVYNQDKSDTSSR
jgi:hypothetical protein